jgi:alkaline phosphatase D
MQIYRNASFGKLAAFSVLDGRQYRSDQPNGGGICELNHAACSPKCSMLGKQQFAWLQDTLAASEARWNVLANQVPMAIIDLKEGDGHGYAMDKWAGYTCERDRLLAFLEERRVSNPVVITGDIHSNFVNDLRVDDPNGKAPVVATEFIGTSISSGGTPDDAELARIQRFKAKNPSVRFANGERGYVLCTVTSEKWQTEFRVVDDISRPGVPAVTRASFVIETGKAGAQQA